MLTSMNARWSGAASAEEHHWSRAANAANRGAGALNFHSFYLARFFDMIRVTGSIPVAPTIIF